jgi:hypothetical protein
LNPNCVDDAGHPVAHSLQPTDPFAPCPSNTAREFPPVADVHVGIVTSSLGGLGACDPKVYGGHQDDQGHLVSRVKDGTPAVPTYQNLGFLDWDPKNPSATPDESQLPQFEADLGALVSGVGQDGCGYEAQLESWFRFLVEPASGDTVLEAERKAFLRPDSLVTVVMLTDENDCSVRADEDAGIIFAPYGDGHPPRGSKACQTDPNDHCCAPCGYLPADCPADPTCKDPLTDAEDPIDLRCFDQKRRFGHDFLYPTSRYVDALSQPTVEGLDGKTHPNPLFPGPAAGATGRTEGAGLVYFAGIIGVPWQDIARKNAAGQPDLHKGLDADGNAIGGFLSAEEMSAKSGPWGTTWDLILGDPESGKAPADALMRESTGPRTGSDPLLGAPIAPPSATSPSANPVNGHEWNTVNNSAGDLQYACIFPLETPIDCSQGCDCGDPGTNYDNPLCQASDGTYGQKQLRAKAYPGLRELEVLQGLGSQGIVASICPADFDTSAPDYGYNPAVGAIVERLKKRLATTCLPLKLTPQPDDTFPCIVIEAHQADPVDPHSTDEACKCASPGRTPVKGDGPLRAEQQAQVQGAALGETYACYCEIDQLLGAERDACQNDAGHAPELNGQSVDGWCYVDPLAGLGNKQIVQDCPADSRRELRFVNGGNPEPKTTTYMTCTE